MRLDIKKIKTYKDFLGLSWADIAKIGGLNSKQAAFNKAARGSAMNAEFFATIFDVDPVELIERSATNKPAAK